MLFNKALSEMTSGTIGDRVGIPMRGKTGVDIDWLTSDGCNILFELHPFDDTQALTHILLQIPCNHRIFRAERRRVISITNKNRFNVSAFYPKAM